MSHLTIRKRRSSLIFPAAIVEPSQLPAPPEYSEDALRKALGKASKALVRWDPPRGKEVW